MAELTLMLRPKREGLCVFGQGDCGAKAKAVTTVDTTVTNKTVSNYMQSKAASASAQSTNINEMNVKISKIGDGCDMTLGQKIDSKVKALSSIDATDTKEIRSRVAADLKSQVDQAAAAKSGAFATAASSSDTAANYKTQINNIIESNLSDSQQTAAFASAFNKNTMTLDLGECSASGVNKAKLNVSQNIASDLQAEAILKSVATAIANYESTLTSTTETKQDSKAESQGGLDALFQGISGILSSIGGVYIVLMLLVCCGALAFFYFVLS